MPVLRIAVFLLVLLFLTFRNMILNLVIHKFLCAEFALGRSVRALVFLVMPHRFLLNPLFAPRAWRRTFVNLLDNVLYAILDSTFLASFNTGPTLFGMNFHASDSLWLPTVHAVPSSRATLQMTVHLACHHSQAAFTLLKFVAFFDMFFFHFFLVHLMANGTALKEQLAGGHMLHKLLFREFRLSADGAVVPSCTENLSFGL
mmetsp:Transcript_10260/g.25159  ORF Transcript_10260/g.25159 Transcript_10260/m.25159 type:complete len:202 (-) Transcript_10260:180-785(-)